jgi:hypothetical protein
MPAADSPDPGGPHPDDTLDYERDARAAVQERLDEITDTASRLQAPPELLDDRDDCPSCHGTGKVLRTADYLTEIVGMLPADDPIKMDMIIADFYARLVGTDSVKGAAPHLAEFFPADLTTGDALNSKGNKQRDQLLDALVKLLTRYDPDHPHSDAMEALKTNAQTWGRSHSAWYRKSDGGVYEPTEDDYIAVRNVLVNLLMEGLDGRLTPRHIGALVKAYRTVSLWMQTAADEWRMEQGEPVIARRSRPAVAR